MMAAMLSPPSCLAGGSSARGDDVIGRRAGLEVIRGAGGCVADSGELVSTVFSFGLAKFWVQAIKSRDCSSACHAANANTPATEGQRQVDCFANGSPRDERRDQTPGRSR